MTDKKVRRTPLYLAAAFVAVIIASNALTYGLGMVHDELSDTNHRIAR